ncbi:CvpA family protein [Blattabacterium sp. (Cryptocercus kyebangensis)]|uniref:CvpA family protein n=1 Tax=Blattabacterium sp. (Cryptocercus kyebangensis) TaxID=298656 RepID=UPI002936F809|nr:CvpA family protein [Blattabacterium sp. (Cryptocercus kyebangensis)]
MITDIIILITLLYGGYHGYKKGLLSQLFVFMIFFILIYKGIDIFYLVSEILPKKVNGSNKEPFFIGYSIIISFFLIILTAFLTKKILEFFFIITWIQPIEKWLGGILGLIKYFFYLSICILLLKEVNEKINLIPYHFFQNSFEKEFQYIFSIYRKGPQFFFKKLEELYFQI